MEPAANGEGVRAEEGDAVGTTAGGGVPATCVVLVVGAGLVGVTRAVGPGVVDGRAAVGRGVEGTAVDEPAGCAGAWGPAAPGGLKYTQAARAIRKTAVRTQVEVRTRRIIRSQPALRFLAQSAG